MARYTKARRVPERGAWDDDVPLLLNLEVPEHLPTWTGLYDADGDPVMREPRPIGFGRMKEWS